MKKYLPFLFILVASIVIRAYRLSDLTTFGGDQGQDFMVVRDMVLFHKWTLLGIKTSAYAFFQGPLYLYMLFPFFAFFKLDPIAGSLAAIFYSSVALTFLYITVNKYFSKTAALVSSALFAVSPELIVYGNTPLYQHFLPIFVISSIYFYLIPKKNFLVGLLLGLTLGLGVETHLLNISLLIAVTILLVLTKKWRVVLGNILGILMGLAPTIVFELRHNFLNTNLLLNYHSTGTKSGSIFQIVYSWLHGAGVFLAANSSFLGFLILIFVFAVFVTKKIKTYEYSNLSKLAVTLALVIIVFSLKFSAFAYFYILPFWLIMLVLVPVSVEKVLSKKVATVVMVTLVLLNLIVSVKRMGASNGYTMPEGWNMSKIKNTTNIIGEDSKTHPNFNVASVLDAESRAYALRYTLTVNGTKPESVESYPSNNFLYVITRGGVNDLQNFTLWEIVTFKPFSVGAIWDLGEGIYLYRLERESWLKFNNK